jgi:polar amino acid transport system permease protein
MFSAPVLEGVKITFLLAVASQLAGIIIGVFSALGRLSTLRLGPRFLSHAALCWFLAWFSHPALEGEFNRWWSNHWGPNPVGGIEVWLAWFLVIAGILIMVAGLAGRLPGNRSERLRKFATAPWYPLRAISGVYIWIFRGTPLLVQIFFVYFAVPQMSNDSILIDAIPSAFIALALNEGAYMTEIVRAGISSVDSGQSEAAQSLGMTRMQLMFRIVLPQAVRVIIPPTGNEFISMLKNTSLAYAIGVTELFYATSIIYQSGEGYGSQHFFELLTVAAVWYLIMTTVASFFQSLLERHYNRGFQRETSESILGIVGRLGVGRRWLVVPSMLGRR